MAIDKFFYILIVLVFGASFITTGTKTEQKVKTNNPLITAEKFVLNRHNSYQNSDTIVGDKYAKYVDYELYQDVVIDMIHENKPTKISATNMKRYKDILQLDGNITFANQDIEFKTAQLKYNTKTSIAQAPQKYTAMYGGLFINGDKLVVDLHKKTISSNNIIMKQRN
jgi:hypothetical protein